jgi:Uma2 family endonuclease
VPGRSCARPAQSPLALLDDSEPEPDLAIVPSGDYVRRLPTTALLVVEVADSSLKKDRLVKAELYAAAGIPEYWLVNLTARVIEVRTAPAERRYCNTRRYSGRSSIHLHSFPDVAITVGEVVPGSRPRSAR